MQVVCARCKTPIPHLAGCKIVVRIGKALLPLYGYRPEVGDLVCAACERPVRTWFNANGGLVMSMLSAASRGWYQGVKRA
jgi:hypothetical protein